MAVRSVPNPQTDLRLARRYVMLLLLLVPLSAALYGFAMRGSTIPEWSLGTVEASRRGKILAVDGTVLAEGTVDARRYPQGMLAAHLVGFSGAVQPDGRYGLEGLEFTLDERLQRGENVITTINPSFQATAQAELKRVVEAVQGESGAVVAIETGTGRILAAASYPNYDPNHQGSVEDRSIMLNRAFLQQVEPGSTMKPFVVAALLDEGRITTSTMVDAPQQLRVGDKTFRDVVQHDPQLSIPDILADSSNSGMIHLGQLFTSQELHDWYRRFGFGQSVGLSYAYDRSGHLIPWERWVPQDHASASIGQSVTTTALQLATAYSIFANDGLYVQPRLVEDEPWQEPYRVVSTAVARTIRSLLVYVVDNSGLRLAKIPGVLVGGKSGTADVYDPALGTYVDNEYTLHFVGMFPADRPRVTMAVYVHKPKLETSSTYVAAPLFQAIGTETVAQWGVAPRPAQFADGQ